MNIVGHIAARTMFLPEIRAMGYELVTAANGVFIRAEDPRMYAMARVRDRLLAEAEIQRAIAPGRLHSLRPEFRLKVPRVSAGFLPALLKRARQILPNEFCCQFVLRDDSWRCLVPPQRVGRTAVQFTDIADAVIDVHSHNSMAAFWSATDDADEQGLRVYVVIGHVDTDKPQALARVGVYGHHLAVPLSAVFESPNPFLEVIP